METHLISQDEKGNLILRELPKTGKILKPSAFKPRLRLGGGGFELNEHNVQWCRYAEEENIFTVIKAPYMKWQIPLEYVDTFQWRLNGSKENRTCFLKDVVLVTQQKPNNIEVYMFHGNNKAPSLNNVYQDSRLCLQGWDIYPDKQMIPAKSIIKHIEDSPGSDHAMVNGSREIFHITMEKDMPILHPELDEVKIHPYASERAKFE